jgi:hypothetical protein
MVSNAIQTTSQKYEPKEMNMNQEAEVRLEKIREVSGIVRGICKGLFAAAILAYTGLAVLFCFGFTSGGLVISIGETTIPANSTSIGTALLYLIFLTIPFIIALKGLSHINRLFFYYEKGNIFTTETVAQLKQIGVTFLLWTGYEIFASVLALCVSAYLKNSMFIDINPSILLSLFLGVFFVLISWVMETGRGLHEENELTI